MAAALTNGQRRTLDALATTLLPSGVGAAPGASEVGLSERLDQQLRGYDRATLGLVKAMIIGFDLMGVTSRHLRPFSRMSLEQRNAFLAGVESGRLGLRRDLAMGLKALISLAYFSSPEVRGTIKYDGLPLVPVVNDKPGTKLPVTHYHDIADGARDQADVVIVGTGAGGAVAAYELASAGLSVVMVEEGGPFSREDFTGRPVLERLDRAYRDHGLTFTTGNVTISLPMGKAVGGTTVVNSGTCFRTPDWILEVGPGVRRQRHRRRDHGSVLRPGRGDPQRHARARGGPGHQRRDPAARRPGPRMERRPHLPQHPWLPRLGGMRLRLPPGRQAVDAAELLADGGRGRSQDLRPLPGPPGAPRRHPGDRGQGRHHRSRDRPRAGHPGDQGRDGGGRRRRCLLTAAAAAKRAGGHQPPALSQPAHPPRRRRDGDVRRGAPGPLPFFGEKLVQHVVDYPRMASVGMMVSDHTSGRVFQRPGGRPLMYYNMGKEETRRMAEAIKMAGELYFAAGAREFYPIMRGYPVIHSAAEVRQIDPGRVRPGDLKLSAYHPMGTARMGEDSRRAVVDSNGRSFACENLYVCDTSLFPSSTAVNPQLTLMATAHRIGRRLADRLS